MALVVLRVTSITLATLPSTSTISPTSNDLSMKIKTPPITSWKSSWSASPSPTKSAAEAAKKAAEAQAKADAGLKDADAAEKKNGNGDK